MKDACLFFRFVYVLVFKITFVMFCFVICFFILEMFVTICWIRVVFACVVPWLVWLSVVVGMSCACAHVCFLSCRHGQ